VKSLPVDSKEHRPSVPWASIAGRRNIVVHEYFRANPHLIIDILDDHLQRLTDAIREDAR
jgi:uncharacterized protein with HEPN domain